MSQPSEEQQRALDLLEELIASTGRAQRRTDLLKPADSEYTEGWHFSVRSCFHRALDIDKTEKSVDGVKQKVATQGARFAFDKGDTLYTEAKAYTAPRAKLSARETAGVQVRSATSADVKSGKRLPGRVAFDLFAVGKQGKSFEAKGSHELTQDEFVRFLILGPEVLENV